MLWRKCELVLIKIGKVITGVMMRTTIVDVNGMVEIVVVIMSTQNTALLVYAWIPMHKEVGRGSPSPSDCGSPHREPINL